MPQTRLITTFPQFPQYQVLVTLFEGVTNSSDIRKELLAANSDFEYAFVSAATIFSLEHLLAGVYRAIADSEAGCLRTRKLHSEIIFCLSPNNNIMDGLRRFGISDDCTSILAIKVINTNTETVEPAYEFLKANINGTEIPVTDLNIQAHCETMILKKNYKLPNTLDLNNHQAVNTALVGGITLRGS